MAHVATETTRDGRSDSDEDGLGAIPLRNRPRNENNRPAPSAFTAPGIPTPKLINGADTQTSPGTTEEVATTSRTSTTTKAVSSPWTQMFGKTPMEQAWAIGGMILFGSSMGMMMGGASSLGLIGGGVSVPIGAMIGRMAYNYFYGNSSSYTPSTEARISAAPIGELIDRARENKIKGKTDPTLVAIEPKERVNEKA